MLLGKQTDSEWTLFDSCSMVSREGQSAKSSPHGGHICAARSCPGLLGVCHAKSSVPIMAEYSPENGCRVQLTSFLLNFYFLFLLTFTLSLSYCLKGKLI
jgi:hypothetical protein